jgi:hypothetical protein
MKTSRRLAVLKQICAYVGTEVSTTNGYSIDLTGPRAVARGRFYFGKDDVLPMLSVLENPRADRTPDDAGWSHEQQKDDWVLLLMGWVPDDFENPTDPAHEAMVDVRTALGQFRIAFYEKQLGGTPVDGALVDIELEPGVVRPPDELSSKAYFWMRVILTISEDIDSLYWVT